MWSRRVIGIRSRRGDTGISYSLSVLGLRDRGRSPPPSTWILAARSRRWHHLSLVCWSNILIMGRGAGERLSSGSLGLASGARHHPALVQSIKALGDPPFPPRFCLPTFFSVPDTKPTLNKPALLSLGGSTSQQRQQRTPLVYSIDSGSMLSQRLRRWPSIEPESCSNTNPARSRWPPRRFTTKIGLPGEHSPSICRRALF